VVSKAAQRIGKDFCEMIALITADDHECTENNAYMQQADW